MFHRAGGGLDFFARLHLGTGLRTAEGATVMGLRPGVRVQHGTIALIHVTARLRLAAGGCSAATAGNR